MKYIWKCLNSDNKDWRRVLKVFLNNLYFNQTIALIEYLIKNGAPRCIGEFKDEIFKIRTFNDFYILESGADRGASSNYYLLVKVREKTKTVLDLLANEKQIEEERENAKKIKERLNGKDSNIFCQLMEVLKLWVVTHPIKLMVQVRRVQVQQSKQIMIIVTNIIIFKHVSMESITRIAPAKVKEDQINIEIKKKKMHNKNKVKNQRQMIY